MSKHACVRETEDNSGISFLSCKFWYLTQVIKCAKPCCRPRTNNITNFLPSFFFVFLETGSHCICITLAGLKLTESTTCAPQVLKLNECTTTPILRTFSRRKEFPPCRLHNRSMLHCFKKEF